MAEIVPDARQLAIYGRSWSERLTRLMQTYRMSQSRLASVVGLSAPMVSQLISGQRVKISNPVVYGRIVRLEELSIGTAVMDGDPTSIAAVLTEVAAANPVLTTREVPITSPRSRPDDVTAALRSVADSAQLTAVAAAARATGADALADLLEAAAATSA